MRDSNRFDVTGTTVNTCDESHRLGRSGAALGAAIMARFDHVGTQVVVHLAREWTDLDAKSQAIVEGLLPVTCSTLRWELSQLNGGSIDSKSPDGAFVGL